MTMTIYMQTWGGLDSCRPRAAADGRMGRHDWSLWTACGSVAVEWECVKPHASADRTADTTRGDTVPWESQTLRGNKSMKLMPF